MAQQLSTLQLFTPLNREEEKQKFIFDRKYNPQFVYDKEANLGVVTKYGLYSDEYLDVAKKILTIGMEKKGEQDDFNALVEGKRLDQKGVETQTYAYLKLYGLDKKITVRFTKRLASRTSITWPYINFRLPVAHAEHGLIFTLHHEIATHVLRKVNDDQQVWSQQRNKFELVAPYETEEGLAAINSHMFREMTLLWSPALYYYAACQAMNMSFAELFADLHQYIKSDDSRWNICMRVKRGIEDTSQPGAFHKDQLYFRGAIQVLRWFKKHDFDPRPLYIGKIAAEDLEKAQTLSPGYVPIVPVFMADDKMEYYKERVRLLIKENKLDTVLVDEKE